MVIVAVYTFHLSLVEELLHCAVLRRVSESRADKYVRYKKGGGERGREGERRLTCKQQCSNNETPVVVGVSVKIVLQRLVPCDEERR